MGPPNTMKREFSTPMTPVRNEKVKKIGGKENDKSQSVSDSSSSSAATNSSHNSSPNGATINSEITRYDLDRIFSTLKDLKNGQDSLKQSFEQRIDNLKKDFCETLDAKLDEVKDEFAIDISRLDNKFKELEVRMDSLVSTQSLQNTPPFDPNLTIVAIGIPYGKTENLQEKVENLVDAIKDNPPPGGDRHLADAKIINCLRMPERSDGKHPLVKIQFENLNQKISILRGKNILKDTRNFKRVFLRTSKSHTERLMEQNILTLLKMIPSGEEKLKLSSSGHLIPKPPPNAWEQRRDQQNKQQNGSDNHSKT